MNLLEYILFGKTYGLCIFCRKKTRLSDSIYHKGHMCICKKCNSSIDVAPFLYTYEGTEYISFTIAPLYYTGVVRNAIHGMKFSSFCKIAEVLSYYVNTYLSVFEDSEDSVLKDFDFLVPVPLSKTRLNERGYNQSEIISRCISEKFGIPTRADVLVKTKNTKPQSILTHAERKTNIEGAYSCTKDLHGKNIILVDDVFTTGSTLNACAKALKERGAGQIIAITVTHGTKNQHSDIYYDLFT